MFKKFEKNYYKNYINYFNDNTIDKNEKSDNDIENNNSEIINTDI